MLATLLDTDAVFAVELHPFIEPARATVFAPTLSLSAVAAPTEAMPTVNTEKTMQRVSRMARADLARRPIFVFIFISLSIGILKFTADHSVNR